MDVERIQQLAAKYPEIQELLKDNYSVSVQLIAARMQAWQLATAERVKEFDANHTRAQAKLADRVKGLEDRLEHAAKFNGALLKRVKALEAANGKTP